MIKEWENELLHRLRKASFEQQLIEELKAEAGNLGFDHCNYGVRLPLQLSKPKIIMFNTYPMTWQKRYQSRNYQRIDPTIQHGVRSQTPLIWTDEVFRNTREFWEEARGYGLRYGWSQSTVGPQSLRGMLTLSRRHGSLTASEMNAHGYQLVWLTQVVHQSMSKLLSARLLPEAHVDLSLREKDVLRWTAEGKSSLEIADLLNITERTVNFHIANILKKMNCANRTAAAVRATLLGLLD
ncbi:autoinducer binding domain-containing protein [Propionivibrio dicarboxylicus]|uniref:LuxR family transcriptional regulator n=1 Tax=Propionivibrio dicarboxylicus TaxID=83767 RepID=A0A1G7YG32_9RHOO|nr:autoinducer binding domain-containing protein [Propionivibrio dicarboxylicus]SDG95297.1 LuxR family transcriptional regulator [Propionivibrio dicarboxylicus]